MFGGCGCTDLPDLVTGTKQTNSTLNSLRHFFAPWPVENKRHWNVLTLFTLVQSGRGHKQHRMNPEARINIWVACLTCVSVPASVRSWCTRSGLQDSASLPACFYKFLSQVEKQSQTGRLTNEADNNTLHIKHPVSNVFAHMPVFVVLSLTSLSSRRVCSVPPCASRYFEWKSRPSKLCQGIRAALGRGPPLAQLALSRWLRPRT